MSSGAHPAPAGTPFVPHSLPWHKRLVAALIYLLIRSITLTLRTRVNDPAGILATVNGSQLIYCVWHNRLALALPSYAEFFATVKKRMRMAALVSASRDGAIVARILELFGAKPARGSSSRRGGQAILELSSWAQQGFDLALTPDGPRGPRYKVQEGAIALAQITGVPLLPVSFHLTRKIVLKSWDRFQIPLPFSRWTVDIGKPIYVARDLTEEGRKLLQTELESALAAITHDGPVHPASAR